SRNVSGLIPSSPATCLTALIIVGCDGRVSASIRNARSRISGEYFLFIVFHPCLKNGTKVRPIQPFVSLPLAAAATFHRARSTKPRPRLLAGMWICVAVFAVLEAAALLLLPVYAVALGWATT
ncbi:hypothetical protein, partial [Microbacterium paludicola]|uniref:hypothetical protein n=1 Tax=Microbacterium paludicola TaxID=300019 RepID=UPI0014302CC4